MERGLGFSLPKIWCFYCEDSINMAKNSTKKAKKKFNTWFECMQVQSQLKKIILKRIKNLLLVQYSRFGPALDATNTARILSTCFENSRLIQ